MQDFLIALAFVQLPVALSYLKLEKQSYKDIFKSTKIFISHKFAILGSFLNVLGVLLLWLAFEKTIASIASPLTAIYPVLMVILAYFLLKEKSLKKDYIGIAFVALGVLIISFS